MEELQITIVGNDMIDITRCIFSDLKLNAVNQPETGRLGNFRTFTFRVPIDEDSVIIKRKELMKAYYDARLWPMYRHGNWMHIYVFKPFH